jgi:hypothetical protein
MSPVKTDSKVDAFMAALDHPLKLDIEFVRNVVLAIAPGVTEGIKWNAPSFRLADDFATMNLRSTDGVCVILHTGAKKRTPVPDMGVPDPSGLLEWLAKDRCMARLGAGKALRANRKAFEAVLNAWVALLPE